MGEVEEDKRREAWSRRLSEQCREGGERLGRTYLMRCWRSFGGRAGERERWGLDQTREDGLRCGRLFISASTRNGDIFNGDVSTLVDLQM
jgi:hypothetical protein